MATKSISQLDTQATANETDLFEVAIVDANSASGYASKKESAAAIADAIVGEYQYPLRITGTTAKTIAGAINELKNLVDLLPQFAIEVVNTLPVSDISTTTIYLVPASDPEQGNYYEEYIYVNNAWELVGTTAVDLTGYYTSAQVDTLLAAKANTSSLATVATSGAYSDLSGKPTIDTALDNASTNAVENRAVASEINSIKSDITVEGSASGDIATFVDGSDNPLKALTISIVAQQAGTGDPSPDNVRPISGWTGANIYKRGFNLWDEEWELGLYNINNGNPVTSSTRIRTKNPIPILPNTTYIKVTPNNGFQYLVFFDKNMTYVGAQNPGQGNKTFTTPANAYYMHSYTENDTYGTTYNNDISINYPSTDTAYHAYNGETINIDWEDEAGTVYGGTLDVKTGELTVTHAIIQLLSSMSWSRDEGQGRCRLYTRIFGMKADSTEVYSEVFKGADTLMTIPYEWQARTNGTPSIIIGAPIGFSLQDWKDLLDEETIHLVYPLATPIEYNLTPQQINSLLGLNNVWADCGAVTELKYIRDLNLCINDIISRIEALEGASNTRSLSLSTTLTKSLTSDSDKTEGILEGKTEEETEEETEEAQNER